MWKRPSRRPFEHVGQRREVHVLRAIEDAALVDLATHSRDLLVGPTSLVSGS